MRTTFVTGGCGFVGRNLVKNLLDDGIDTILIVDDLSSGQHPDEWLPVRSVTRPDSRTWLYETDSGATVRFLLSDIRSALPVLPETSGLGQRPLFSDVYHLAARVGGRLALDGKPLLIAENLTIDTVFYSWACQAAESIERVLYMSSSAVYPLQLQRHGSSRPLKESFVDEMPLVNTDGMYGWAKLTGEFLSRTAVRKTGLHVACVRPFSGYGPDQDLNYPVPALAARARRGEDPFVVWGSGDQQRDFIYISDLVAGMRRSIDRISDGRAVNLGTGVGTALRDVALMLSRHAGHTPRIAPDVLRPVGAQVRVADIGRMADLLEWVPSVDVESGLRSVLQDPVADIA